MVRAFVVLPTDRWALQASAARLSEAEAGHDDEPRVDVDRITVSAAYHRMARAGSIWASTIGWGRNHEPGTGATNAFLAETSVTIDERHTWFGRFEVAEKSGHDLSIDTEDVFTVGKLQAGYTRYLPAWNGLKPGIGAEASAGIVPDSLKSFYGDRFNPGFGVYVTVRPASSSRPETARR